MTIFIIALILLIICLAFAIPIKLYFHLDSESNLITVRTASLRINTEFAEAGAHVCVFVFDKKILSKRLSAGKKPDYSALKALSIRDTSLKTCYGLDDPQITGIIFVAINMISAISVIRDMEQNPDFLPTHEYLRLDGSTKLNVGKTVVNLVRLKRNRRKRYGYSD